MAPLGLLGGTFDPVHNAHLSLAQTALRELSLGGVRWIPSGRPGHRATPDTPIEHRLAMLRLALAGETRFALDEADARSPEPTYTVATLARLRRELGPSIPLVFLMGADQLRALDRWRDWRSLFDAAHIAVADRPGHPIGQADLPPAVAAELDARAAGDTGGLPAGRILRFVMTPLEISSTAVRDTLAHAHSPAAMLPPSVFDYIQSHALYRNKSH